jgi:hypothetical protein
LNTESGSLRVCTFRRGKIEGKMAHLVFFPLQLAGPLATKNISLCRAEGAIGADHESASQREEDL